MAIISKLQLALVCFLFSLLVDPSEARGRGGGRSRGGGGGFFVVIFGSESPPVWIGKLSTKNMYIMYSSGFIFSFYIFRHRYCNLCVKCMLLHLSLHDGRRRRRRN